MQENNKNVWVGKDDLAGDVKKVATESAKFFELPIAQQLTEDRSQLMSSETNRRDFLKYLGFGIGAAAIAASCETPVRRAIPYVNRPDAIVPGVPTYYASSFVRGGDYCSILVKTREGRPIKIEGNRLSPISEGGTSARAQAAVLELYDAARIAGPTLNGNKTDWQTLDADIKVKVSSASNIRLISSTLLSPNSKKIIDDFMSRFPGSQHISYDAISSAALLDAHQTALDQRAIPGYNFDQAQVIVSLDADFLGTWISPTEYATDYIKGRKIKSRDQKEMTRLYSVESAMSLTGSNADNRIVVKPSQSALALVAIYNRVAQQKGGSKVTIQGTLDDKTKSKLEHLADDLIATSNSGGHSLIVNGTNNYGEQLLTIELNRILGNYGHSIDLNRTCLLRQGDDKAMNTFVDELESGSVGAIIFLDDANPVYDSVHGARIARALNKTNTKISTAIRPNETSVHCNYLAPNHHFLENWGDAEPYQGELSLIQPVIEPLFDTRSQEVSLHLWAGNPAHTGEDRADYQLLRASWAARGDDKYWATALHDGVALSGGASTLSVGAIDVSEAARAFGRRNSSEKEVKFYETVNIGSGIYAGNPWLQEMPDPIYRTVWDNFVTIPVSWDGNRTIDGMNGWAYGDLIEMTIGGAKITAPVVDQFGVVEGSHGMALGYGRSNSGRACDGVGKNAYPHLSVDENGHTRYYAPISFGNKVGKDEDFATVQYHHTFGIKDTDPNTGEVINVDEQSISSIAKGYQGALTDRSILFYTDLPDLDADLNTLDEHREKAAYLNAQSIYEGYDHLYDTGHKWEMSVDLNSCIGCGACQVACVAENNVPVVGKHEVSRHHEMTWLRIDRYFFGDIESPNTAYQPMMCQHCDNAPCENVCPVGATQHSTEGLNHMTYNRCIGTRYCANNCPYKVRRFNWLDYTSADLFGQNENDPLPGEGEKPFYADNMTRMVLNPDVTVRSRGVIEKCSFCIQIIQAGKLIAKSDGRAVADGDVNTACATACPTGAIVFGDINDKKSMIAEMEAHPLNYYVLEETNTRSAVGYLMKVTNKNGKINELDA